MYYPVISSVLIGFNLPEIIVEKKYERIPLLVVFPAAYTGYKIGAVVYANNKEIENQKKKQENRLGKYEEDLKKPWW